jgi:hypothetical protein
MARQTGVHKITGTIGNLCFYKMEEKFYVRTRSSLTSKRVKNDPKFKQTMQYANLLAEASTIASSLYKKLNERQKIKGLYRKLTGEVMYLLKKGITRTKATHELEKIYCKKPVKKNIVHPQLWQIFFLKHISQIAFTEQRVERDFVCRSTIHYPP